MNNFTASTIKRSAHEDQYATKTWYVSQDMRSIKTLDKSRHGDSTPDITKKGNSEQ